MKRAASIFVTLCAALLAALAYVSFYGSVIVHDDTGKVISAVITNGQTEWSLLKLPGGKFFRVPPRADGEIEVRCSDGSSDRGEYVSHNTHVAVRVAEIPCRLSRNP